MPYEIGSRSSKKLKRSKGIFVDCLYMIFSSAAKDFDKPEVLMSSLESLSDYTMLDGHMTYEGNSNSIFVHNYRPGPSSKSSLGIGGGVAISAKLGVVIGEVLEIKDYGAVGNGVKSKKIIEVFVFIYHQKHLNCVLLLF